MPFISISSTLAEITEPETGDGVDWGCAADCDGRFRGECHVCGSGYAGCVPADSTADNAAVEHVAVSGAFATDATCCILSGFVRPKSQVDVAAWVGSRKYVRAFDVVFDCRGENFVAAYSVCCGIHRI